MAFSPEIEKPLVTEIPESPEIPPELEQGISTTTTTHTNIPQVSDDPLLQITAVPIPPNPAGPSIVLPADPQIFTQQAKGSTDDTSTWNAWFWLRMIKKAIAHQIQIVIAGTK